MTKKEQEAQAEQAAATSGQVPESIYKDMVNKVDEKDELISQLQADLSSKDTEISQQRHVIKDLKQATKTEEPKEETQAAPQGITPEQLQEAITAALSAKEQQSASTTLDTLLGGVEDEYKREVIKNNLEVINIEDPQKAFDTATILAEAEAAKMAGGAPKQDAGQPAPKPGEKSYTEQPQGRDPVISDIRKNVFGLSEED